MAETTACRNLNPPHSHRPYPRVVKRTRHNYRIKQPTDTGTRPGLHHRIMVLAMLG
jgi:hypothetical protein